MKEGAVHLHIKEGNLAATKPSAYSSKTFDGKIAENWDKNASQQLKQLSRPKLISGWAGKWPRAAFVSFVNGELLLPCNF